jgi:hypothetical protein
MVQLGLYREVWNNFLFSQYTVIPMVADLVVILDSSKKKQPFYISTITLKFSTKCALFSYLN